MFRLLSEAHKAFLDVKGLIKTDLPDLLFYHSEYMYIDLCIDLNIFLHEQIFIG